MNRFLGKAKNSIYNMLFPLSDYNVNRPFKSYSLQVDNKSFSVFVPKEEKIVAAHENVVCTQKNGEDNVLFLYPDINRDRKKHKIVLNNKTFPGLISGSRVQIVFLLPFIFKDLKGGARPPKWRLVVITDKCQVYHNNPDEMVHKKGAETAFCESLIWDLPGNRYPSCNEDCEEYEYYNPFLPKTAYEYHPAGESPRYIKVEGKDGKQEVLSRFYFPTRTALTNPFCYMGGYEPDSIISLVGTYLGNSSQKTTGRIVVFATTDGGKTWFAKYEFNDLGKEQNYGNAIRCNRKDAACNTVPSNLILTKRELISSKTEGMILKSGKSNQIKSIEWGDILELSFSSKHKLSAGEIVALQGDSTDKYESALINNEFSDGNYGNGKFYKVKVVDEYRIQLFECASKSRTNLPARHIHSINRVKDGFLLATGEIYPNGWLLMINLRCADNWGDVSAEETFESTDITKAGTFSVIRLNTGENSVQRILGATLISGQEPEIVYASDCSTMIKERTVLNNRGTVISNSIGIYRGKLRDIDDIKKFSLLEEVKEPSFFFKVLDNCYVFSGQRGELAIGTDNGTKWTHGKLNEPFIQYMGRTLNYFVIDGKILRIK